MSQQKPGEPEATNFTIGLQVQFARPTRAAMLLISPGNPLRLHAMEIHRVASRSFLRASLLSPRIPFVLDFASRLGAGCTLLRKRALSPAHFKSMCRGPNRHRIKFAILYFQRPR